jgi:hypothetical protein
MSERTAFRLALVAAVAMLAAGAFMGVREPCQPLPMSAMIAFELARSPADLNRIFDTGEEGCGTEIARQLEHANMLDTFAYVPAYAAFFVLVLYALGRRDKALGWTGIVLVLVCAIADLVENAAMFGITYGLGAADDPLAMLIVATNVKWIGLAIATTLAGAMLWRRGGLGWVGFLACAIPLPVSVWALIAPDAAGRYLIPGMAAASVMLLAVAVWGSIAKVAGQQAAS